MVSPTVTGEVKGHQVPHSAVAVERLQEGAAGAGQAGGSGAFHPGLVRCAADTRHICWAVQSGSGLFELCVHVLYVWLCICGDMCIHVFLFVCVCVCVCMHACVCVHACVRAYMRACMRMGVCVCVRETERVCVRERECLCACMCVCLPVHAFACACMFE